jgi:hypothetical protein
MLDSHSTRASDYSSRAISSLLGDSGGIFFGRV